MSYKIKSISAFDKEIKQLSKKFFSLKKEFEELLDTLETNPFIGTPLGKDCYKIRLSIKSKNRGKSGGARVITCVKIVGKTVYLLSIYDKSNFDTILDEDLNARLKEIK